MSSTDPYTTDPAISYSDRDFTIFPMESPPDKPYYTIMTPRQYSYALRYVLVPHYAIAVGGILGNILNIRTFLRMGLKDCVTITFFNLAISDLCLLTTSIARSTLTALEMVMIDHDFGYIPTVFGVEPDSFKFYVGLFMEIFLFASSYFVPFLAVQRSLCVVLPLQFKGLFTAKRTGIILSMIWGYSLFCRAMDAAVYGLSEKFFEKANSTVLVLSFPIPHIGKHVKKWTNVMNNIVLFAASNFIVLGGLIIMIYALNKSARFRERTSSSHFESSRDEAQDQNKLKKMTAAADDKGSSSAKSISTASKERQAIVQVAVLSFFYLLSYLPVVFLFIADLKRPHIYFKGFYIEMYVMFWLANASVNVLVYYKYNSRFRQVCFHKDE